jgi:D-alanine-D-alanine ligase-like ATP-grasp enzyme
MHTNIKLRALIGPNQWAGSTLLEVRAVGLANPHHGLMPAAAAGIVQDWLRRRDLLDAKAPALSSLNWASQLGALITALRSHARLEPAQIHTKDEGATLLFTVEDASLGHLTVDAAFALCRVSEMVPGRKDEALQSVLDTFGKHMMDLGFDLPVVIASREAQRLGIPHRRHSLLRNHYLIGEGRHQVVLDATDTNRTFAMAKDLAANKDIANSLLGAYGFPVPRQETISKVGDAWSAAQRVGLPAVFKPRVGQQGTGVVLDVKTKTEAVAAFETAIKGDRGGKGIKEVLVEATLPGDDHRIMVIGEGVIALRRQPPSVVGDGVHTIAQLIERENATRGRTRGELNAIETNDETTRLLTAKSRTLQSILAAGESQQLLMVPDGSWPRSDVSAAMHPETRHMLLEVARLIGLDVASIDFRTPDITRSWREVGGGICEVESRSGLWALVRAEGGTVGNFVRHLVAGRPLRIPQVLGVGSGDLSALDEWAQSLAVTCREIFNGRIAVQTSAEFSIDGHAVPCEPLTSARACLRAVEHPEVRAAIYVSPADACLANGLGVQRPDFVVVRGDGEQREIGAIVARAGARMVPWERRHEIEDLLRSHDPVVVPASQ